MSVKAGDFVIVQGTQQVSQAFDESCYPGQVVFYEGERINSLKF